MSPLFSNMRKCCLSENMRTDIEEVEFTDFLLKLGNGKEEIHENLGDFTIQLPSEYLVKSVGDLIETVFPPPGTDNDLIDGAIYTPLNLQCCFHKWVMLEQASWRVQGLSIS